MPLFPGLARRLLNRSDKHHAHTLRELIYRRNQLADRTSTLTSRRFPRKRRPHIQENRDSHIRETGGVAKEVIIFRSQSKRKPAPDRDICGMGLKHANQTVPLFREVNRFQSRSIRIVQQVVVVLYFQLADLLSERLIFLDCSRDLHLPVRGHGP